MTNSRDKGSLFEGSSVKIELKSGCGRVTGQGPTHEGVCMTMADPVLGFEVIDDRHVLLDPTIGNDLLPLGD